MFPAALFPAALFPAALVPAASLPVVLAPAGIAAAPGAAVASATPSSAAVIPPVTAGAAISRCRRTRRSGRAVSSQPQPMISTASSAPLSPAAKPDSPAACGAVPMPSPVAWVIR